VDLDTAVQQWGREHHIAALGKRARERIELVTANVLEVECPLVDIVLAMNFSYWIFKERDLLRSYFRSVRQGLNDDGLFMLDAYGGPDAHREQRERTKFTRFTYVWDQHGYNPLNGDLTCHIHFSFPDGSRLKKAFTYEWRLWTVPEIREILLEAGFRSATVYWEGTDEKTGEGNGEFSATEVGEADDAFVIYIVAEK
jgi:cyclopropane fatty-acyl-phospholipid synthase-like methyltransferase